MSGGFLYFYRTYTATASGSVRRHERCVGCSCVFEYSITREVQGGGHAPFFLGGAGAAEDARMRACANLKRALDEAVEPIHCPTCGIFQPHMVEVLRQRYGRQCKPNKYASERIAIPIRTAWRLACEANTVESYTRFIGVWPTWAWHAKQRIKELKYTDLRKVFWIVWIAVALFIASFIFRSVGC
jgi:hypothetical protein